MTRASRWAATAGEAPRTSAAMPAAMRLKRIARPLRDTIATPRPSLILWVENYALARPRAKRRPATHHPKPIAVQGGRPQKTELNPPPPQEIEPDPLIDD